jgi:hypothetical protein
MEQSGRNRWHLPQPDRRIDVYQDNKARTHNGHIRNDTRDVLRRIPDSSNGPICRRNCVASDRACPRVTLPNFHGKEGVDGSSPSEGLYKSPANGIVRCLLWRDFGTSRVRDGYILGLAGTRGRDISRRSVGRARGSRSRPLARKVPATRALVLPVLALSWPPLSPERGSIGRSAPVRTVVNVNRQRTTGTQRLSTCGHTQSPKTSTTPNCRQIWSSQL